MVYLSNTQLLIIDDDEGARESLSDILQEQSYKVTIVGTGSEAIEKAKKILFDVALVDIRLPDMDGITLIKRLRQTNEKISCLMITGFASQETAIEAVQRGAKGYFIKPLVIDNLLTRINELREQHQLQYKIIESEEKFRTIFEGSIDSIFLADPTSGIILDTNRAAEELLGRSKKELLGMHQAKMHQPEKAEEYGKMFQNGVKAKKAEDWEAEIQRKDGSLVPVSISANLITLGGKEIMIGIFRDITERKEYTRNLENTVHERTEEIRKLNEKISEKLRSKIQQINNISKLREKLMKISGIGNRVDGIFERALDDLSMDVASVIIFDEELKKVQVRYFKSRINNIKRNEAKWNESIEKNCLRLEVPHSKINKEYTCVLNTKSVHCAPIFLKDKAIGVLALGNMKEEMLDEEDLSILNLYSGLITTVLETAELTVTPAKELVEHSKREHKLEYGTGYVIEDNLDFAYEVFTDNIKSGMDGLCITRIFPKKVKEKYGIVKTPVVWINETANSNYQSVNALQDLSIMITNYLAEAEKPIILIDGIEYLISINGFDLVVRFIQSKRSQIESSGGVLIIPFARDALDTKEVNLIERELEEYKPKRIKDQAILRG